MSHISMSDAELAPRTGSGDEEDGDAGTGRPRRKGLVRSAVILLALLAAGAFIAWRDIRPAAPAPMVAPPPEVTVSTPLQQDVADSTSFLGQFSAVDTVELRAQVGGTLMAIGFTDGQIVHKGQLLFTIDPRPYEIKLAQAAAQLETSQAKSVLATAELWRAQQLKNTSFGTAESVDQRAADERAAGAAIAAAQAGLADAKLDLEFSRITAPFTGRIGAHLVSVGNLVSGSRGGTSPTTPLATIVSLDPIYLDFDMSEADYLAYQKARADAGTQTNDVAISLDGDGHFDRRGTLDFIDNALDRSSGTIHARATVPNPDLAITPGQFARLRLTVGKPTPALLVPAAAVVPDQSREMVMTVAPDGTVKPKLVVTGALHRGLRVIRDGLSPTDRVVIDGVVRARPGDKVTPVSGSIAPGPSDAAG